MHGGIDCCGNFYVIRPMELKYPSQSWILDSTPWVPDSRYWTPFFAVELGLWFPVVSGILDSSSCVPDPKGQDFRVPLAKISGILLHGVKYTSGTAQGVACWDPPAPPLFQMVIFFFLHWLPRSVTYHTNKV